jgi:hypothetical protein
MSCRIRRTQMMAQGSCEKPVNPTLKKELDTKLAQIQAERMKQDQMWNSTVLKTEVPSNAPIPNVTEPTETPSSRKF